MATINEVIMEALARRAAKDPEDSKSLAVFMADMSTSSLERATTAKHSRVAGLVTELKALESAGIAKTDPLYQQVVDATAKTIEAWDTHIASITARR